jgi:hypothetical protein
MQKYYDKLDDTGVYYAAMVLNPHMKRFCKNAWKEYPLCLQKAEIAFQRLWDKYKFKDVLDQTTGFTTVTPTLTVKERPYAGVDAHTEAYCYESNEEQNNPATLDEYQCWNILPPLKKEHPLAFDPITYWFQERINWPQLGQFALNILTIPGASADVEAIFSELGDMLEPRRARLQPDFLAAAQCNRNWERNGFIKK